MPKKTKSNGLLVALMITLLLILLVGCGTNTPTGDTNVNTNTNEADTNQNQEHTEENGNEHDDDADESSELVGDPVRGGLLYDKWWAVPASGEEVEQDHEEEDEHGFTGEKPEGDHLLWAGQSTNTRSGSDTWRCKECHGWDYKGPDGAYGPDSSHFTGFPGVLGSMDKTAEEVLGALTGATNSDHDFSAVMEQQDLIDLALFMTGNLIDNDLLINADKSSKGDVEAGAILYGDVCTNCHGPSGNAINFGGLGDLEYLGHLAPDNPWEFVHKVRFGQPGWPMPSAIANQWPLDDVGNVLAYAQTFTEDASVSDGGLLWDKWWSVLDVDAPETDQPLWAGQSTNTRSGSDTWRCKECHGWDYQGADGAYGSGSHFTGFAGILDTTGYSYEEVVAWLDGTNNADHDFSPYMDEVAYTALASFIQDEVVDISPYVNEDGSVIGDPLQGQEMFDATCQFCHGTDGKLINFGDADDPEYLGTVAAGNPWEFFHKVSFGQPGAPMPAGLAMGWSLEDIANLLAFSQTLPTQ